MDENDLEGVDVVLDDDDLMEFLTAMAYDAFHGDDESEDYGPGGAWLEFMDDEENEAHVKSWRRMVATVASLVSEAVCADVGEVTTRNLGDIELGDEYNDG